MNMTRWIPVLAAAASWIAPLRSQDAASTLGSLVQEAHAVVQARFLGTTHEGQRRAARFATTHELAGERIGPSFTLTEPDGRACGRALGGLIPGASYVAFLWRDESGTTRLASSGSRALPLATPDLLTHVRARSATPRADWTAKLVAALDVSDPRVRTDAALDLARRPDLERLTLTHRNAILDALAEGLEDEAAPHTALIQAAARSRPEGSAAVLVRQFVDGRTPWLDRSLLDALGRLPAADVAACLPGHALRGARSVEIAERLDARPGIQALAGIAVGSVDPVTRMRAATALTQRGYGDGDLLGIGVRPSDLPSAAARGRPTFRFRSIDPTLLPAGAPR
jgi:hypothetical protein